MTTTIIEDIDAMKGQLSRCMERHGDLLRQRAETHRLLYEAYGKLLAAKVAVGVQVSETNEGN